MGKRFFKKWVGMFLLLSIFSGCSLSGKEDFEMQAKAHLEHLTLELGKVQDLKGLKTRQRHLKKRFSKITDLMMAYHLFLEKHPELKTSPCDFLVLSAAGLKTELLRLIEIEGALDLLIEIQKDPYLKLTLMEESLSKETLQR